MPSTNQIGNGSTPDYPDEPTKMLATKTTATLRALIRGIRREDRANAYIQAEIRLAERDGREPRKKLIGMLNTKASDLAKRAQDAT